MLKPHLMAIFATLLIAGSFISSDHLAGQINPYSLTLLRFVLAATILSPVVLFQKEYRRILLSVLPKGLVLSLSYSAFFILMFNALETTSSLNTGSLYTLVPLLTAVASLFIFKAQITINQVLVYLLGVIGTIWVVFGSQISSIGQIKQSITINSGDGLFLIAILFMVSFSIMMKRLHNGEPMPVMVLGTLLGGVFWMSLALFIFKQPLSWHLLPTNAWFHVGYLAIFATLATTYLMQKTTVMIGPTKVMAYTYLSPAMVFVLLLIIEGASFKPFILPGLLISFFATVVLQYQQKAQKLAFKIVD